MRIKILAGSTPSRVLEMTFTANSSSPVARSTQRYTVPKEPRPSRSPRAKCRSNASGQLASRQASPSSGRSASATAAAASPAAPRAPAPGAPRGAPRAQAGQQLAPGRSAASGCAGCLHGQASAAGHTRGASTPLVHAVCDAQLRPASRPADMTAKGLCGRARSNSVPQAVPTRLP